MFHLRSWLNRRKIDGSLNRTPLGFYDRVWQILERTPNGIVVAETHLPQVIISSSHAALSTVGSIEEFVKANWVTAPNFWAQTASRLPEDFDLSPGFRATAPMLSCWCVCFSC